MVQWCFTLHLWGSIIVQVSIWTSRDQRIVVHVLASRMQITWWYAVYLAGYLCDVYVCVCVYLTFCRKINWKLNKNWMKWRQNCKQPQKKSRLEKRKKGECLLERSSYYSIHFIMVTFIPCVLCRKPIFTPGRREPGTPRHTPRRIGLWYELCI